MEHSKKPQKTNQIFTKRCRICGDITLVHFNFNGLSCQSCKKFFRRNVDKIKEYKCQKNGKCLITKLTRKSCKRCRFDKCIEIGMRMDLISKTGKLNHILPNTENFKANNSIISGFEPYELMMIQEVQSGMSVFGDENSLETIGNAEEDQLLQVVNLSAIYIRKVINFCKNVSAFTRLNQDDQIIVLKSFYPHISAVYAAHIYCVERDGFKIMANESNDKTLFVKMDFYKEFRDKNSIPTFRRFAHSLRTEIGNDILIRDLIIAQVLFRKHENTSCPEFIRYNHLVYCHLLLRYLQEKYRDHEQAELKYQKIMQILTEMDPISEVIRELYINDIDKCQLSHILAEIYNLI